MNSTRRLPLWRRAVPGLTLIVLTPLIIEVLPGATRLSVITSFPGVLPMQMGVWGCAALLIRAAVRRWRLGWLNMLFLGLALAIAEEFIIQQTSLAPMVLQIFPGEPFARAWGVNYVYLLWALGYESVFAVLVPVALTELMFRSRREQPWVGKWTAVLLCPVFLLASVFAWYIWTRFARPMGFHVPIYDPPLASMAIGAAAILALVIAALGPSRRALLIERKPLTPAPPWLLGTGTFVAAMIWHGLVLLAFGIAPAFPEAIAVTVGVAVAALSLYWLPRFAAHPAWRDTHRLGVASGAIIGAMTSGFAAFIYGTAKLDLYGKIVLNLLAVILLSCLAVRLKRSDASR